MPAPDVLPADLDARPLSRALALVVLLCVGALLLLWLAGGEPMSRVLTSTMKGNSAICLTALAASLLLAQRSARWPALALAGIAIAISLITLVEYAAGVDLGIDQLFVRDALQPEGLPGRIAPNAAQGIATLGVAVALFPRPGRRRAIAGGLALFVLFEALLALLGYLHGTRSLYQIARALRISQYTAAGLLLLSVAALAAWPAGTAVHLLVRRTAGGLLARRVLPPLFAIPILLGFLRNAGERAGLYDDALGTALMTAGILLFAGLLIWQNARIIDRLDENQRRSSAENGRLAAEARAAVAARDEFIALAGHELRTPLTAMRLQAQLEQRRADQRRTQELQRWTRLIDRLGRLVETMLDTSRVAERKLDLQRTTVDLAALVQGTIDRLSGVFAAAQAAIAFRADPGLLVDGDAFRIEQALENVLLNAAKYGAGRDVEVTLSRDGRHARLSVRDQGFGIAPEDQERIFWRFERAVPAENFGGLGLGLYLARQVMHAHGGTITVESAPGQGATFHLRLPLTGAGETSARA